MILIMKTNHKYRWRKSQVLPVGGAAAYVIRLSWRGKSKASLSLLSCLYCVQEELISQYCFLVPQGTNLVPSKWAHAGFVGGKCQNRVVWGQSVPWAYTWPEQRSRAHSFGSSSPVPVSQLVTQPSFVDTSFSFGDTFEGDYWRRHLARNDAHSWPNLLMNRTPGRPRSPYSFFYLTWRVHGVQLSCSISTLTCNNNNNSKSFIIQNKNLRLY